MALYEFALREIACIVCEQGHSVVPFLGDEIADRALQEVQRLARSMSVSQESENKESNFHEHGNNH